jgi:hypothetical protein
LVMFLPLKVRFIPVFMHDNTTDCDGTHEGRKSRAMTNNQTD